jgi:imidazole glycerol-phosphate synthase subunit HisF
MFQKRIIICLDVREGKTTKGIKFQGNIDIGDPVEMAAEYYRQGVDELVFYDITASHEKRNIMIDVVEMVAQRIFIPFCVGGGIGSLDDIKKVIGAGAEKVSLNSQAVKNPKLISDGAGHFGNQCIVLGMDALKDASMPSGYRVVINGGRIPTELDALAWAKRAEELGAGEIVLNSIDADGTQDGYELQVTKIISDNVGIPVVASGGAGKPEHLADVMTKGNADAALVASMVQFGGYTVPELKEYLLGQNIPVRDPELSKND